MNTARAVFILKNYKEIADYCEQNFDKKLFKSNVEVLLYIFKKMTPVKCMYCGEFLNYRRIVDGIKICGSKKCKKLLSQNLINHEQMKKIIKEKYGVDNVSQLQSVQNKIKETSLTRYGVEHFTQCKEIKEKTKQTNLKKYGVECPTQNKDVKEKTKQTNIEKYGVEHPLQSEEIKEKVKQTNLEKYGVDYPLQLKNIQNKSKKTCLEKYGVENVFQSETIKEKIKQTNLEKYGVEYTSQTQEFKKKFKQTCLEKYGVEYPTQNDQIKEHIKQTCLEKYGVEYPAQSVEIKEKTKQTNLEKYGVEYPTQNDQIKEHIKQTCLEKYGVEYSIQSKEVKEKAKQTCLMKFGVENPAQSEYVREKARQTCLINFGVETPFQSQELREKARQTYLDNYYNSFKTKYKDIAPLFTKDEFNGVQYYKKYKWKCLQCGNEFEDHIYSHIPRCLICKPLDTSLPEQDLAFFVKQFYPNLEIHNRQLIKPYELDILIPDLHLALEFNGNYWHSIEAGLNSNYHLMKTELCEANSYRLIHIWEDEWNNDKELIKEKLIQVFENKEIIDYSKPLDRSWHSIFQVQNHNVEILPPEVIERNGYHVENCGYLEVKND